MQLSRLERWQLYNQYRILARLYPEEANYYDHGAEALGRGYELEYGRLAQHISERGLNADECRFVISVMDMFQRLQWGHHDLPEEERAKIPLNRLAFPGFDGNNEGAYLGYARYVVDERRAFQGLATMFPDLNSHMPTLGRYRNQFEAWRAVAGKEKLTKEDILGVIETGWD